MSARERGMRFMVSKSAPSGWFHPAEIKHDPERFADYTDCTAMSDAEFDAFMGVPA